jgi:Phosphate-induced protein 1 conserved region
MTTQRFKTFTFIALSFTLLTTGVWLSHRPLVARAINQPTITSPTITPTTATEGEGGISPLIYRGGPVMSGTMQVYLIFWEPTGSVVSPTYNSLLQQYFTDVSGSGLYKNNSQYPDSSGKAPTDEKLAATWVDTSPYPSTKLQDADIQNEIKKALSTQGWKPDLSKMFFVYTAKSETVCANTITTQGCNFCGYHSFMGTDTIFATIPYQGLNCSPLFPNPASVSPNGDPEADAEISVSSHEQMEAATDPFYTAWADGTPQFSLEMADLCRHSTGPIAANGSNTYLNGHPYLLQEEFDNAQMACVLTGP